MNRFINSIIKYFDLNNDFIAINDTFDIFKKHALIHLSTPIQNSDRIY